MADERDGLLTLARQLDERPRRQHAPRAANSTVMNGRRPGDDFNHRASWVDVLTPHGWHEGRSAGEITEWTRPGKDRGVSATTNYGGSDLLWVFSSSTSFTSDQSY